ncbi:PadR family transcriptional regulator [Nocardia sp. CY41]|uniref:PadR family transcriptional regulator n=1 Tax=Nocardia sp. CY41 TaxID=2608686 RepID=UPI001358B9CE|nr:PadR family transcriptional regulator [Nocardia sp. CY41]
MSLRYALLGLLEDGPASGYQLTARFERSLQKHAWTARQSHIYPELNRLAEAGLIVVAEEGARGRRTYAITEEGRTLLREWLMTPMQTRAVRDEYSLRMFLLSAVEPEQARELVLRYRADALAELDELRSITARADADTHPCGKLRFGRLAAEYGIYQQEALYRWTEWALQVIDAEVSSRNNS